MLTNMQVLQLFVECVYDLCIFFEYKYKFSRVIYRDLLSPELDTRFHREGREGMEYGILRI